MSDLKLYRVTGLEVTELSTSAAKLERDLQKVIERNMETLFGVRMLASEFSTGAVHGGRIDSIGIDENGTPVIFEYKRNVSESVINQGLFYLDWLLDHQGDFWKLVNDRLGAEAATGIDYASPRLICVANDFNRYDEHAIRQMGRAIELVRYQQFAGGLLAFELVASSTASAPINRPKAAKFARSPKQTTPLTAQDDLDKAPPEIRDLHEQLRLSIEALGDDITTKWNKHYLVFRRLKNFASVEVFSQAKKLLVFVKADLTAVSPIPGFSRDVTNIGHMGTGNLELTVDSAESLARALPLIQQSYERN